jgi:hypothetical protein
LTDGAIFSEVVEAIEDAEDAVREAVQFVEVEAEGGDGIEEVGEDAGFQGDFSVGFEGQREFGVGAFLDHGLAEGVGVASLDAQVAELESGELLDEDALRGKHWAEFVLEVLQNRSVFGFGGGGRRRHGGGVKSMLESVGGAALLA